MKKVISIASICVVIFLVACSAQKSTKAEVSETNNISTSVSTHEKKNILFFSIDDLKPLLSNYGESQMHTPKL